MFDQLSERLQSTMARFGDRSQAFTDESIDEALRDVRRALLEADVNLRVLKGFLARVKDRVLGQAEATPQPDQTVQGNGPEKVQRNLTPYQHFIGIVNEELTQLLGGENAPLSIDGKPAIILLFGLQGAGKTTTAGKLALMLRKQGKNPLLVAADVYRPAAIAQLLTLGKQVGIPVHSLPDSTDVQAIAQTGLQVASTNHHDVVIIDTAGRLQIDTDMMAELLLLDRSLHPQEKLLVIDAMTGQEAVNVAEAFNTQLAVTGLVLTKLDGDARGGAALSVRELTGQPIKLIGTSEKMEGLEPFYPDRLASRILGMGDVLSLVEKAQQAISLEDAQAMEKKLRKNQFSLDDFIKIRKQLSMLGSFDQILGMLPIPGLNKEMRENLSHGGEQQMKRIEVIIQSMTPAERQAPELMARSADGGLSRQQRIAKGCGMQPEAVSQFLNQFEMMRGMMGQMSQLFGGGGGDASSSGKGKTKPSANPMFPSFDQAAQQRPKTRGEAMKMMQAMQRKPDKPKNKPLILPFKSPPPNKLS
jgi:signal recognition particle subunit SRP54